MQKKKNAKKANKNFQIFMKNNISKKNMQKKKT